ncbi:MAG: DUF805 domain-containing protein [Lutibacter sp.]|nr:DUF805 domain-containing protein [Lutibacter sp.]
MYNLFFKRLFSFKGRSSRKEYTARLLLIIFIMILWTYTIDLYDNKDNLFSFIYIVSLGTFGIIMFFQYFPLTIRRLHDLNASGWYVLITFLPFGQFLILWSIFKKGTQGSNKFGDSPDNYNESYTTLKYNLLVCSGIVLLMYLIIYKINSLREDKENSILIAKISAEYYKRENYDEALKGFNVAISLTPKEDSLYSARGSTLVKLQRFDEALNDYNKTLELNPLAFETYKKKIHVLITQSNYTEALKMCELLLKNAYEKDHIVCAYIAKATIFYKLEKYDEALECVDKILATNPNNENALKIKNKILKNMKRL